jgi:hypothetical protein
MKLTRVEVTPQMDVIIDRAGEVLTLSATEVRMAALALQDSLERMMPVRVPSPEVARPCPVCVPRHSDTCERRTHHVPKGPLKSENWDDET